MKNIYFNNRFSKPVAGFVILSLTLFQLFSVGFLFPVKIALAADTGVEYPGTVSTNSEGSYNDNDWTSPGNVSADDGNNASITADTFDGDDYSYVLRTTNFGFNISTGNTIKGIKVEIERHKSAGSARDAIVQLTKNGTARVGNNRADTTDWLTSATIETYGGETDPWGTTWTPAEINASTFGVHLAAQARSNNTDIYVDFIRITVYYTPPTSIPFTETFGTANSGTVSGWVEKEPAEILGSNDGADVTQDGIASDKFVKIGEDGYVCRAFDAIGKINVFLSYFWNGDHEAESNDYGKVEYKTAGDCSDASGWTNISSHPLNQDSHNNWHSQAGIDIPVDNTIFLLRFRNDASHSNEYFRVDDIVIGLTPTDADQDGYTTANDCDDTNPAINPGATESCNNVDDDCDGNIDENLTQPTTCGVGACSGNTGIETCTAGQWGGDTCDPFDGAVSEVCDAQRVDENCDGSSNEGCNCINGDTQSCGSDIGECVSGLQTCAGGAWGVCTGAVYPSDEICDGLDNNCDGNIDEGGVCPTIPYYCDNDQDTYLSTIVSDICSTYNCVPFLCRALIPGDDCNDGNPIINPGATEACGDQIDNNCNGSVDENCPYCGDGYCNGNDNCENCPGDCGPCQIPSVCGNQVKEGDEECDGTDGVIQGQNFCTVNCQLVPIYDGQHSCPEGTIQSPEPVITQQISSDDSDGEIINLGIGSRLLEVIGTFIPTTAPGYLSDAGYTTINGELSLLYGIHGIPPDYAAHALLSDFGTGTVGVVDWGEYNPDHIYTKYYNAQNENGTQFVVGDRYSNWFNTQWQNQGGIDDNEGSLTLNIYQCNPAPVCDPGYQQSCKADAQGACALGTQTCDENGFWGECIPAKPTTEICDNEADDDCDGVSDEQDVDCRVCDPQVNLINNGGFEEPIVENPALWDIFTSNLTSWITEWMPSVPEQWGQYSRPLTAYLELQRDGIAGDPHNGSHQLAELDSGWGGPNNPVPGNEPASVKIYQDIQTIPGRTYLVIYYFSARPNTAVENNRLEFAWDNAPISTVEAGGEQITVWTPYSYILPAISNTTRIQFSDVGNPDSYGTYLDDVSVRCQLNVCEDTFCDINAGESCETCPQDCGECAPQPINGGWSEWGSCSTTCDGGTQTRTCTNPEPAYDGADCEGDSSQPCNTQACPLASTGGGGGTPGPYVSVCGNGILEGGEYCDDGNLINGDGCSSVCAIEQVAGATTEQQGEGEQGTGQEQGGGGQQGGGGEVLGLGTGAPSETGTEGTEEETSSEEQGGEEEPNLIGEVEGEETESGSHFPWWIIILAIVLIIILFLIFGKKKQPNK